MTSGAHGDGGVQATDSIAHFLTRAAQVYSANDFGASVQSIGELLLGRPYVAGMLDEPASESLVLSIESFDCVLLVETTLAAARVVASGAALDSDSFGREIQNMRYREGTLNGFCSRLHYFSDWIASNEEAGMVRDVTADIGGIPYDHQLDFMSSNRSLYRQIADNDSLFAGIVETESDLRRRKFYYIPQSDIRNSYSGIRAGDIVAITTAVAGLDISHTGIAHVQEDGSVGFLHASTADGVKIAPDLSDYVNGNKKQTGIMITRPLPPTK